MDGNAVTALTAHEAADAGAVSEWFLNMLSFDDGTFAEFSDAGAGAEEEMAKPWSPWPMWSRTLSPLTNGDLDGIPELGPLESQEHEPIETLNVISVVNKLGRKQDMDVLRRDLFTTQRSSSDAVHLDIPLKVERIVRLIVRDRYYLPLFGSIVSQERESTEDLTPFTVGFELIRPTSRPQA
ncbi:hypothetical protein ACJZ2D_000132 [Fusarium nematophilum]